MDERARYYHQVGIATAFLVGGLMATSASGLSEYFGIITTISALLAVGTYLQVRISANYV